MTDTTLAPTAPQMKLVFATKALQQVPFQLGGTNFISKRLLGEEDLLWQEAQNIASLGLNPNDDLLNQADVLAGILRRRKAGDGDASFITHDWVEQHVGPATLDTLLLYLRTGHNGPGLVLKQGESLELPVVAPTEIDGRTFAGRLMNYAEFRQLRAAMNEVDMMTRAGKVALLGENMPELVASGEVREVLSSAAGMYHEQAEMQRRKAQIIAGMLNSRWVDDGEPVDGAWLLERLELEQLEEILNFYLTGKNKESDTPNADTPANLPFQG